MARRKVVTVAEGKDAATVKEFADFLEAHGGKRAAVTDASIDMGAAFEAGIKENFPNALARPAAHGSSRRGRTDRRNHHHRRAQGRKRTRNAQLSKGRQGQDAAMKRLDITGDPFHPEWNCTIKPRPYPQPSHLLF